MMCPPDQSSLVKNSHTLLIIILPSVSLPLTFTALQTSQPPKVLFPPERQDTSIEITPGKDQQLFSISLFFGSRGNPQGTRFSNAVSICGAKCSFLWCFFMAPICDTTMDASMFTLSHQRWTAGVQL